MRQRKLEPGFYIRRGVEKPDDEIVLVIHGPNGDRARGIVFAGTVTVAGGPILNQRMTNFGKTQKEEFLVKGNVLEFRFLAYEEGARIDFHAPKGRQVTFTLFADGRPVQSVAFGGKPEWVNGNTFILDTAQ